MGHLVTPDFISLFKDYPPYSQEKLDDPIVVIKLFDNSGSATWFLTEYNPDHNIAFGYVVGMVQDEWGYISIEELENINHPIFSQSIIERDLSFSQQPFRQALANHLKKLESRS